MKTTSRALSHALLNVYDKKKKKNNKSIKNGIKKTTTKTI